MNITELAVDERRLERICLSHGVAKLEVFGSFASGKAEQESDLDLLVTFRPNVRPGLDFVTLAGDLEELFGRPVDLLTRRSVEQSPNKYFRRFALRHTEALYECA